MGKVNRFGKAEILNVKQQEMLLEATTEPLYRCLWSVMRFTGSRVSESLQLTWAAYDGKRLTFISTNTKTKKTRGVLVADRLRKELDAYRKAWVESTGREPKGSDLIFPGRRNEEPLTRQAADLRLRAIVKAAGLPSGTSLHSLRSLATTMVQKGASLPTVQKSPARLAQLQRYVDVSEWMRWQPWHYWVLDLLPPLELA